MQVNWSALADVFDKNKHYVLAIITATEGATYQKPGTLMLIDEQGACHGLLSGGCLEADIALHAAELIDGDHTKLLNYDLRGDDALLWGLGAGCEGRVEILLQVLNKNNVHLQFSHLLQLMAEGQSAYCAINISASGLELFPCELNAQVPEEFVRSIEWPSAIFIPLQPSPRIVIAGAGPDVTPFLHFGELMHWHLTVIDHRPAALANLPAFVHPRLSKKIDVDDVGGADAIVIMTHSLERDADCLSAALQSDSKYIGLLGPKARKEKLLNNILSSDAESINNIHGPIGLDLGGRGAESIALSICAELQQFFNGGSKEEAPVWLRR